MQLESQYYIEGHRKKWFWITVAIMILFYIWPRALTFMYEFFFVELLNLSTNPIAVFILAGIETALYIAAWMLILVAYGIKNRIKLFKYIFIILAVMQILNGYQYFMNSYYVNDMLTQKGYMGENLKATIGLAMILMNLVWFLFAVIILCHRKSSKTLKISGIGIFVSMVIRLASPFVLYPLYHKLSNHLDNSGVSLIVTSIDSVILIITYLSPFIFSGPLLLPNLGRTFISRPAYHNSILGTMYRKANQ